MHKNPNKSKGLVVEYGAINPFSRGDGVTTRLMVGKGNAEDAPFTTGTTIFPAGCAAPLHSHNCSEQVTILEGRAEVMIDGDIQNLASMDSTFIPANLPHYFRNIGDGPLTIFWIYGARDVTRTFTETG
ncbi:cupin domain-containing protein, partial [Planktotalea sp.]|uniref:cupin domain-containing protein n=1 Tax=Planktotalea sp. TaxID=2029877 RepID=UPI003296A0FF